MVQCCCKNGSLEFDKEAKSCVLDKLGGRGGTPGNTVEAKHSTQQEMDNKKKEKRKKKAFYNQINI